MDDDDLFGDEAMAQVKTKRKRKKGKEDLSLLDQLLEEDKAREKRCDALRAQTEASKKRTEALTGELPNLPPAEKTATKGPRESLSPLQIDWAYISKQKKKTPLSPEEEATKSRASKAARVEALLADDDDDEIAQEAGEDLVDAELASTVKLSRRRAETLLESAARFEATTDVDRAFLKVVKRNRAPELREAFTYAGRANLESKGAWRLAHLAALLDPRPGVAPAAARALLEAPVHVDIGDDAIEGLALVVGCPERSTAAGKKKTKSTAGRGLGCGSAAGESGDDSATDLEPPEVTVGRLALCIDVWARRLAPVPLAATARAILEDLCHDAAFSNSGACRAAARRLVRSAAAKAPDALFQGLDPEFLATSLVRVLRVVRLLPIGQASVDFLCRLLAAVLARDTDFARLLDESPKATKDHLLAGFEAMISHAGGGNAAVPVLGCHQRLHVALACLHKLYSAVAPGFHYTDNADLLTKAIDLKARFRNELATMAVRNTDLLGAFIAQLQLAAAAPVKKQGTLSFRKSSQEVAPTTVVPPITAAKA